MVRDGMDRRILSLGRALRDAGATLSTPEIADAALAALAVGVADRADLKSALRATLLKAPAFTAEFNEHFERLFPATVPRPPRDRRGRRHGGPGRPDSVGTGAGASGVCESGLAEPGAAKFGGGGDNAAPPPRPEEPEGGEEGGRAAPDGAAGERRAESDNVRHAAAERARAAQALAVAQRRRQLLERGFRERWSAAEEREALEAMEALALRLATRLARRRVRSRRGGVHLPATLRANLVHGGVPFVLRRRSRSVARRDLVLLADVSGSARRAAALFLKILARLRDRFAGVRAFAYVDRPAEITPAVAALPPAAIEQALAALLPLHALSDHGEALRRFNRDHRAAVSGRSVVVILGDARSNRFPAQEWELEALRRRCLRLAWIVPEPASQWGTADSAIAAYAPHCDRLLAAPTPRALAAAAEQLVTLPGDRRH